MRRRIISVLYSHLAWFPEGEGLHELDLVPVVAVHPRQVRLPHFCQLLLGELARTGCIVVVEPVPVLQSLELKDRTITSIEMTR